MEEMIDDAMTMDDDEEVQEAASEEVDKILFEITNGVNPLRIYITYDICLS